MSYKKYRVLIRIGDRAKHVEVVACDIDAALADVRQGFEGCEIIQAGCA